MVDTPAWVRDAVFYEIFPDRFASSGRVRKPGRLEPWDAPPTHHGFKGGDLLGVVEHLDYLDDLGVTALYLTPVFASAANHRYHTYDYMRVDPLLGGDEALRELLDACHARGMHVVLDGVFNHTGRGFWPFHHVLEAGAASPYRGWFHLDDAALDAGRPLRAYSEQDEVVPLEIDAHPELHRTGELSRRALGYRAWWDLPALPKLNVGDSEAREYVLGVAEHWLRFGIDGWRLDVPEEIADDEFWREFRRRCRSVRPDAYLVAEIWRERPERVTGDQFDALMDYPLAEAILSFAGGSHLDMAQVALQHEYRDFVRPIDAASFADRLDHLLAVYDPNVTAVQLNLLGSHDVTRVLTLCGGDRASLRLATLLQMTLPGAPCVYYGDEVGLEGGPDPDCRRAFPWDEWAWDRDLRTTFRDAIALRRRHRALRDGAWRVLAAEGHLFVQERSDGEDRFLVAINAADRPAQTSLALPERDGTVAVPQPIGGSPSTHQPLTIDEGRLDLALPPREGIILRLEAP